MATLPAERKALLFSEGGVRLALRLSQVREVLAAPEEGGEVRVRGAAVPLLSPAVPLGLSAGIGRFAVVIESATPLALRVSALHGILDLAECEVFQLPARTLLPQPSPFQGAIVARGQIALEVAVSSIGWAPLQPAEDLPDPPPEPPAADERELLFARDGRNFAVPLSLLIQVLEGARVFPVPLTPSAHLGLLYHERSIHPVFDVACLYRLPRSSGEARAVLLLDAGGDAVGVVADRVLGVGESGAAGEVVRPPWDAVFGG